VELSLQPKESLLRKIYEWKYTLGKIKIPPPKHERRHSHFSLVILDKIIQIHQQIPFVRKDKKWNTYTVRIIYVESVVIRFYVDLLQKYFILLPF